MSDYDNHVIELAATRCEVCHGSGKCDDADFGDIYYNEWTCLECKGTGMKEGE